MKYLGRYDFQEGGRYQQGLHWGYIKTFGTPILESLPVEKYISFFLYPERKNKKNERFLLIWLIAWNAEWFRKRFQTMWHEDIKEW